MSQPLQRPDRSVDRFSADAAKSYTMPASYYYDPAILEQEKQKIFYRSWQFVAAASDLAEPGSYVTAQIADQHVVVIRREGGGLSAFFNVCQHRGHLLLEGKGKLRKIITCPYHAWAYDHDGCLVAAPDCDRVQGFEKGDFKIPGVHVEELGGLVFVNLDPQALPMDACYPGLRDAVLKHFPNPEEFTCFRETPFDIAGNWKNVGDNALECYHCAKTHRDFVDLVDMDSYEVHCHDNWSFQIGTCRPENKAYNFGEALACGDKFLVFFVFPGLFFSRFAGSDGMLTFQFSPTGTETTFQKIAFYGRGEKLTDIEHRVMDYFSDVLGPEDVDLVESVQKGLHSLGYHQGRFIVDDSLIATGEHAVHHFHALVLNALQD